MVALTKMLYTLTNFIRIIFKFFVSNIFGGFGGFTALVGFWSIINHFYFKGISRSFFGFFFIGGTHSNCARRFYFNFSSFSLFRFRELKLYFFKRHTYLLHIADATRIRNNCLDGIVVHKAKLFTINFKPCSCIHTEHDVITNFTPRPFRKSFFI